MGLPADHGLHSYHLPRIVCEKRRTCTHKVFSVDRYRAFLFGHYDRQAVRWELHAKLRGKFELDPAKPLFKTIRGVGYQMMP